MQKTPLLLIVFLSAAAVSAQVRRQPKPTSADNFPIEHGFYVERDTPCGQATSKMDVQLYEGKTLEGTRGKVCSVDKRPLGPARWRVKTFCPAVGYSPMLESEQTVTVTSMESYDVQTTPQNGGLTYHMRLCRTQDLPEPWRSVSVR